MLFFVAMPLLSALFLFFGQIFAGIARAWEKKHQAQQNFELLSTHIVLYVSHVLFVSLIGWNAILNVHLMRNWIIQQ